MGSHRNRWSRRLFTPSLWCGRWSIWKARKRSCITTSSWIPIRNDYCTFSGFYPRTNIKPFGRQRQDSFYQVFLTASPTSISCSPILVVHYQSCPHVLHLASIMTLLLPLAWNMMRVSTLENFTLMQLPMAQKSSALSVMQLRARHVMNKIPSSKSNRIGVLVATGCSLVRIILSFHL